MIFVRKQKKQVKNDFWIGFSDLMTGLMLVFIVLSLTFMIKANEIYSKTEAKKEEIINILVASENANNKVEVSKELMLRLFERLEKLYH